MYPIVAKIDAGYLHRWMLSLTFTEWASSAQGRTVLPKINQEALSVIQVPVPPLAEQQRIVAKIAELTARSRAARAALNEVPTLLEQFRQSVLASAFRGDLTADWRAKNPTAEPASVLLDRIRAERRKQWETNYPKKNYVELDPVDEAELPELPEGWCWTTIEESCSAIVDCPHSTPAWTATGRICVRTTEFRPGVLDLSDAKFVSEATFQERISRLVPQQGDILYSREGGILGIAVMIPPNVELCLGQRMMLLRADRRVSAALLMHWLNSPYIVDRVRGLTTGSASPHLNVGDVKRFPIPLMPPDEQEQVVAQIKRSDARRTLVMEAVDDVERQLQHLNQSILAKAFRGELVPQDPADEPASVLLARIRAAQSDNSTDGTGKRTRRNRTTEA
jgi:type I restriction enzyme S subunit